MDDPVVEIEDVVRSLTEPSEATAIAKNVEKYFTPSAYITHPFFNQPRTGNGRKDLVGIYRMLRVFTLNNKIEFHAVMFNGDKTQGTIELTEHVTMRLNPISRYFGVREGVRFLVRIDLEKSPEDGKYRISRQDDNFPSDLTTSGIHRSFPGLSVLNNVVKGTIGFLAAKLGRILLSQGWLGP
ncbi:hypothetical protein CROQUDRAFT_715265 [Cronartium quercuum f. sp. fusiforme G11]|uniref:SigF-like NTF2-like domain-containing protein n=1 Tax=Cronartium quercuum f. sp. fusiforme G11 TaxID=708437 RepID=A0A9P6NMQ5_9BASI|nr:hypothetical protein CROQUDRAFT_715265 [Cronartium quercuum f. sp. fusiforme G11]